MKTRTKYILMGIIFVVAVAIDLITKQIFHDIEYTQIIPHVIAFQTNGGNSGAAFGIFANNTLFLIVFSILIVGLMIFVDVKLKIKSKTYTIGFGLIMAGAIGNMIDRITLKYVRDFIMFDFWKSFPIFNFADCCIVIGAVLVCVYFIFLAKNNNEKSNKSKLNNNIKVDNDADNK